MADEFITLDISETKLAQWVIKFRLPDRGGPSDVFLLLHGWTGDENSMSIFISRLPKDMIIISPRGLFNTPLGGFGWRPSGSEIWPDINAFNRAIEALNELFDTGKKSFPSYLSISFNRLKIVGFSQGAALGYSYALLNPDRVQSLAGLSGFLPSGIDEQLKNEPLLEKAVFIAHGTRDEIVPVERAREAVNKLRVAGANVTYCEDNVGHKLSLTCFQGLEKFFFKQNNIDN